MRRILLVTTASDLAADLVIFHLGRRGVPFIRFNQEDFPSRVSMIWSGDARTARLMVAGEAIGCEEIHSAWFRYPIERSAIGSVDQRADEFAARENAGFLDGFWETTPWFWMNRPSAVVHASSKLLQLARAGGFGFRVPQTLVTNCADTARTFVSGRESIAKPVVTGGLGDTHGGQVIYTTPISSADLVDGELSLAPVIFQERIANSFDLRVTVIGASVFATRISARGHDREVDWRALDPAQLDYERYYLPADIEAACVALVRAFGLSFAALDFIVTPQGEHIFLEINPSGQWGWLEESTAMPITDAIIDRLLEGVPCAST